MENKSVSISDYMQGRKYNHKLYDRLLYKLEIVYDHHNQGFQGLTITISMSAKYQTPYVMIETTNKDYRRIGGMEQDIIDALDEVGFDYSESEDKGEWYLINFTD